MYAVCVTLVHFSRDWKSLGVYLARPLPLESTSSFASVGKCTLQNWCILILRINRIQLQPGRFLRQQRFPTRLRRTSWFLHFMINSSRCNRQAPNRFLPFTTFTGQLHGKLRMPSTSIRVVFSGRDLHNKSFLYSPSVGGAFAPLALRFVVLYNARYSLLTPYIIASPQPKSSHCPKLHRHPMGPKIVTLIQVL